MKRIALGAVTGLSVWFASALAAEAQQITPTGPTLVVNPGDTSATLLLAVTLPYPSFFRVKINVTQNGTNLYSNITLVPNPGTTTYTYSRYMSFSQPAQVGTIDFQYTLIFAGNQYTNDLLVTVNATRPSSKALTVRPSAAMAVQAVDRDRRREQ
jgi:hypothetical protein